MINWFGKGSADVSGPQGQVKVPPPAPLPVKKALTCEPVEKLPMQGQDMSGQQVDPPPPPEPPVVEKLGICEICKTKQVEDNGFCARYGKYNRDMPVEQRKWMCDDCVFQIRWQAAQGAPPLKPPMTRRQVEEAIGAADVAAGNLTLFEGFKARDPSGACRDIDYLHLTYREARPVLDALKKALEDKLAAMP
jgi:hypothetical protein